MQRLTDISEIYQTIIFSTLPLSVKVEKMIIRSLKMESQNIDLGKPIKMEWYERLLADQTYHLSLAIRRREELDNIHKAELQHLKEEHAVQLRQHKQYISQEQQTFFNNKHRQLKVQHTVELRQKQASYETQLQQSEERYTSELQSLRDEYDCHVHRLQRESETHRMRVWLLMYSLIVLFAIYMYV